VARLRLAPGSQVSVSVEAERVRLFPS
jgi:hypothetical protein